MNHAAFLRRMAGLDAMLSRLSDVPRQTAQEVAPALNRLVQAGFDAGTDPYGQAWKPLRAATLRKGRRPPPLSASRDMRGAFTIRPSTGGRAGLRLVVGAPYARFHQTGTRYMARRELAPSKGLPASWRLALVAASRAVGQRVLLTSREVA